MKTRLFWLVFALSLAFVSIAFSQIVLNGGDFPSTTGMVFITEDDTSGALPVNIGLPGENQTWSLENTFPHILSTQNIVDCQSTPCAAFFPATNLVTQYEGFLGSQINSFFFNGIAGTFYTYQEKRPNSIVLKGIGVESGTYTGPIVFEPEILYFTLPLEFGKSWSATSHFSISMDTSFFGIPATLVANIQNTLVSTVDGWGTIKLPAATFNCVRVKSYITLDEKLYMSGELFKEHNSRTINYFWIAEAYGVVAKVMSQLDETNDNFTNAAQISRFHSFSSSSGVHQPQNPAQNFHFFPNFPNPFNAVTQVLFEINEPGQVQIEIFNLQGQWIRTLTRQFLQDGNHQIQWNGTNSMNESVPSGIYFIKIFYNASAVETQKVILIR